MSAETVTILQATGGLTARKTFIAGREPIKFRAGKTFFYELRECRGIEEFGQLLTETERDPRKLIIRGRPKPHLRAEHPVLRRCSSDGAAFDPQPRYLTCLDIDSIEAPAGVSPISVEALEYVVSILPAEFRNASYVAQWSSSAGLAGQKIKAHYWFWLATPHSDTQMRRWAASTGIVDPKIYSPVHPHYTAAPAFVGMDDPFAGRSRVTYVPKLEQPVALRVPEGRTVPTQGPRKDSEDDTEIVRDSEGKAVDGREELLKRIRYRVFHDHRPKTEDDFIELVLRVHRGVPRTPSR